jgi:hypothetical protein
MGNATSLQNKLLWCGAIVALVVGVGTGLSALSASLGVWLGLWGFGKGFQILGAVNPYTGWVALFCLIEGIALLIMSKLWHSTNGPKLFSYAIVGSIAACIAWYIPTTFQAPEGESFPPIHDVSTDLIDPPSYVAVLPLRADSPNTVVYGGSEGMTPESHAQMQIEAYPDLVPQMLSATPEEVFDRALAAVDKMGWELVAAAPEEGRIEATATTFWFRFKDDVVIRIQAEGNQTRIDARSLSRVGRGDVGANAIRLREFFEIL